jgi:hypothetical protein
MTGPSRRARLVGLLAAGIGLTVACGCLLVASGQDALARDSVGHALPGPRPASADHPTAGPIYDPEAVFGGGGATNQTSATVGRLAFRAWAFAALDVPVGLRPFDFPAPGAFHGDPDRVSMRVVNGVPYDFPLRNAETGFHALSSYRWTGDKRYLRRAEAQARHLIAIRVTVGDAWFYPSGFAYRFNRTRPELLVPPWYQGLAQGIATGFFARLYEVTGKRAYLSAAEHTLNSLLVPRRAGRPWVSNVDTDGYLRIEEYPGTGWRFVFNGHMQAALGLWDYYRVTRDARALALYRGALTSVARYGERFRTPGWISAYSLGARAQFIHYHEGHLRRLLQLYRLSGDDRFVRLAILFDEDFPAPTVSGVVRVPPGEHALRRFSTAGARLASRVLRVRSAEFHRVDRRARVAGQAGIWLRIAGGPLKGWSIREAAGGSYVRGPINAQDFDPPVGVTLRAGEWVARQFDAAGRVTASQAIDVATAITVQVSRRAVLNGRRMVLLASDPLPGHWLPERAVVLP